ncbi:dTDP-4-dehydrorhamnose reductase [Symmachiella dynata]|uniref:dTDP-4-dehydrorhamnose reductase n=1 Tax=Symmachiella dynata TaxID=2527995 RepID=UPI0030EB9195
MRIALTGARGQLASDLLPLLGNDVVPLGHAELDITRPDDVTAKLHEIQPDFVINCAAYNLVDKAEEEPEVAYAVNATGPKNLAQSCADLGIGLAHISSDYVFGQDAQRAVPYTENDPPGPQGAYAQSKRAGEEFVSSICPRHFVIRTCGLYGIASTRGKGNFVETMLRLGSERDQLSVVNDQRCTPSWTVDVARAIAALIETDQYGLYHATNSGSMTWFEFAAEIFRQSGTQVELSPITTAEFGAPAARPPYSVLSCQKLTDATGLEMPPWQEALANYLSRR